MSLLNQVYKKIDESDWDERQKDLILHEFIEVSDEFHKENLEDDLLKSEAERHTFEFNKNPDKGVFFKLRGERKLDDGTIVPFEWPNIREWDNYQFEHIHKRFQSCKNKYAKSEYGLLLFYKGKLSKEESIVLLDTLIDLTNSYLNKAKINDDEFHYIFNFKAALSNAYYIAYYRKFAEKVKFLTDYIVTTHSEWNLNSRSTLRVIIDLTDFAIKYYREFSRYVDVSRILTKNLEAANFLSNHNNAWGAIYTSDISLKLIKLTKSSRETFLRLKANQCEILAKEGLKRDDISTVSFIVQAMKIHKDLKDEKNHKRLQVEYVKYRNHFTLNKSRMSFTDDETKEILDYIKDTVTNGDQETIIKTLLFLPMIRPLEEIKEMSKGMSHENVLLNLMNSEVIDKFGNTIAKYTSDDEKNDFTFKRVYGIHFQVATQTLINFFLEAHRAEKISYVSVISFLKKTWLNAPAIRKVYGTEKEIDYLAMISPGLELFFKELEYWKNHPTQSPNFMIATDSLILKIEYLLRELCTKFGIPSFKPVPKGPSGIIMECILDELLDGLKFQLGQDNVFFMRYILSDKAGINLRNRIAHGLMDNYEYSFVHPLYALCIILKLSNYKFPNN